MAIQYILRPNVIVEGAKLFGKGTRWLKDKKVAIGNEQYLEPSKIKKVLTLKEKKPFLNSTQIANQTGVRVGDVSSIMKNKGFDMSKIALARQDPKKFVLPNAEKLDDRLTKIFLKKDVDKIKRLTEKNLSSRQIAAQTGLGKTEVATLTNALGISRPSTKAAEAVKAKTLQSMVNYINELKLPGTLNTTETANITKKLMNKININ